MNLVALRQQYEQRHATILVKVAQNLESYIRRCVTGIARIDRVSARAKGVERFLGKASKKTDEGAWKYRDPLGQIQDQVGARIVVYYLSDVETVERCVTDNFRAIERQHIAADNVKEFGYVGRHYILLLPSDVWDRDSHPDTPPCFELQVKTLFQHAWSEAEHDLGYKPGAGLTSEQKRQMAFTAAQAWGADTIFESIFQANLDGPKSV